jgi:hypothetical protein
VIGRIVRTRISALLRGEYILFTIIEDMESFRRRRDSLDAALACRMSCGLPRFVG